MKSTLNAIVIRKISASKVESKWIRGLKKTWPLHMLIFPALVIAIIFHYVPIAGLVMAFQDYKPWLGFLNPNGSALSISTLCLCSRSLCR